MAEEFEDRDLSDSVFWGVDLSRATFRDVNLSGVSISHALLDGVDIDAKIDRLVINGVDVTDYVNERDRWYPLRAMVRPADPEGARAAWAALEQTWAATIARAGRLTDAQRHERVDGEWSFAETLRHLLLAMDKWFTAPILGEGFHPFGIPNTGSVDFPWPGLDRDAAPSFDEVLVARAQRADRFRAWLDELDAAELTREVEVLENGTVTVHDCVFTVLEEEFEHHRYADRDLALLESRAVRGSDPTPAARASAPPTAPGA
jgi:hypothetical protein